MNCMQGHCLEPPESKQTNRVRFGNELSESWQRPRCLIDVSSLFLTWIPGSSDQGPVDSNLWLDSLILRSSFRENSALVNVSRSDSAHASNATLWMTNMAFLGGPVPVHLDTGRLFMNGVSSRLMPLHCICRMTQHCRLHMLVLRTLTTDGDPFALEALFLLNRQSKSADTFNHSHGTCMLKLGVTAPTSSPACAPISYARPLLQPCQTPSNAT